MQWTDRIRQVKIILVVAAVLIAVASLFISHYLVRDLSVQERQKMEVWAELTYLCKSVDILFRHKTRLYRSHTDPLNARNIVNLFKKLYKLRLSLINTVGTHMDTGYYNFLKALCRKVFYLRKDILHITASDPSSGIWYYTIAAELIAAVLNLDISPCVLGKFRESHVLIFVSGVYIND